MQHIVRTFWPFGRLTRDRAQEDDSDQPQIKITLTQTHKRLLVDDWQAGDLRSVRGS